MLRFSLLMRFIAEWKSPESTRAARFAVSSTLRIHAAEVDAPTRLVELRRGLHERATVLGADVHAESLAQLRDRIASGDWHLGKCDLERGEEQRRQLGKRRIEDERIVLGAVVREVPRDDEHEIR